MPAGTLRQVRLVLALGIRRWLNRVTGGRAAKRAAADGGGAVARPPTARRRTGMGLLLAVAALGFIFQATFFMWQFTGKAIASAEHRPPVREWTWDRAVAEARDAKPGWEERVRQSLRGDEGLHQLPEPEQERHIGAALQRLAHAPATDAGLEPAVRRRVAALAAALFALFALCTVALSLGMGNTDLARADWDELWLAALPIANRALFAARLVQYTVINPLVWLLVPAAIIVQACRGGMDWRTGLAIGLTAGVAWAITTAALRLLAETWLRQHLAHARIKNLQAILTVVGMAAMVGIYAIAMGQDPLLPAWFLVWADALPWWVPPSGWAAVAVLLPDETAFWLPLGLISAVAAGTGAVHVCARWSLGGLVVHDGTLSGRRGDGGPAARWRPLGVLGKDLTLLRRDRVLFVQALVMPLFMIALQLSLNPALGRSALSDCHAAATFVVALGGWVLMSATAALAFEGQALWILALAPMPLAHAIRGKVVMWAAFASVYAILALTVILTCLPWPGVSALGDLAMILAGMPLLAALAVGIGAAATDPQTTTPNRRVGIGATYLYMMVLGLFSLTVNRGGVHQRLAMLIILAIIAWALWQRLRDRLAYIFEPVDCPPRQVDLADGAWAAFAFLVLQGLLAAVLIAGGCPLPLAILLAFGAAGALTALGALFLLWRAHAPDLLHAVGIRPPAGTSVLRTVATGCAAGLAAALAAVFYLRLLPLLAPRLPVLQDALDTAAQQPAPLADWYLVVLAVGLAPLCEEFIFRGLLFRGLRRDLSWPTAVLASAAVFAVMHPSLGVVPVFGLGVACALAYESTGWLLAPVLAHALYNGVVVLLQGG